MLLLVSINLRVLFSGESRKFPIKLRFENVFRDFLRIFTPFVLLSAFWPAVRSEPSSAGFLYVAHVNDTSASIQILLDAWKLLRCRRNILNKHVRQK